jgi:hypothetical protein
MRRLNFRLIIAFLAFSLSMSVASSAGLEVTTERSKGSLGHPSGALSSGHARTQKHRKFKLVNRTCESRRNETYESSTGQEVTLLLACYTSTAREAQAEVRRIISEGRVVQRGSRRYRRGRRSKLAKRTVAIYPKDESGEKPVRILLYGRGDICFRYIEAGSLRLALEFERSDEFVEAVLS